MKNKLIMLGTGAAMVTKCYNTCFVLENEKECFLVDAGGGNGILAQLEKAEIPFNKIKNMFITHTHTDHILGAIWVVRKISALMNENKYDGNFNIYCHDEASSTLLQIVNLTIAPKFLKNINTRIFINTVYNGNTLQTDTFKFTFFDIFSNKTKQFGFNVAFDNGKTLACLGDEPFNIDCKKFVEKKDFLLCEAFCLYSQRDIFKPYEKFHSTVADAAKLAQELNIKNLVLYHTEDKTLLTKKQDYKNEAEQFFKNNIIVPFDLEIINI